MDIWKLLNLKRNNEIIYLLLLNLIMIISINKKNIFQKKLNIKYESNFNKMSRKRRKNRKSFSLPSYSPFTKHELNTENTTPIEFINQKTNSIISKKNKKI